MQENQEIEFGFKSPIVITGMIEYKNPIESPSEKVSKIGFGIDCSIDFSGRTISQYVHIDATDVGKNKKTHLLDGIEVGDTVKVKIELGSYMVNVDKNKGNRPVIYNNCNLATLELLEKGKKSIVKKEEINQGNSDNQEIDPLTGEPVVPF